MKVKQLLKEVAWISALTVALFIAGMNVAYAPQVDAQSQIVALN